MMTTRTLHLDLTLPPSVNSAYCQTAEGRRVLTAKARQWKKQAAADIGAKLLAQRCQPFGGTYSLAVCLADQGGRDMDGDNVLKLLIDAIVRSGAVADDNRRCLRSLALEWSPDLPAGTCEVRIEEISPQPHPKPAKAPRPKDAVSNRRAKVPKLRRQTFETAIPATGSGE